MRFFTVITLCLFSLFFDVGCVGKSIPPAEHAGAVSYHLDEADLRLLKSLAQTGNSDAAERVAGYYIFFKGDSREGLKWLDMAAKNGSEHAKITARKIRQALKEAD